MKPDITFQIGVSTRKIDILTNTAGVIGEAKRIDAQHIATATVHKVDALVSWNFRHIVNLDRIRRYNSVNLRHGHPMLEIRTPQEVVEYEE